jgi:antitoxin (DNA-binding transcriptional repressor) of toxin-antitoxin stability system
MTKIVSIHETKTHLSRFLKEIENGDELIIARGNTPIAKLVPITNSRVSFANITPGFLGIDPDAFLTEDQTLTKSLYESGVNP